MEQRHPVIVVFVHIVVGATITASYQRGLDRLAGVDWDEDVDVAHSPLVSHRIVLVADRDTFQKRHWHLHGIAGVNDLDSGIEDSPLPDLRGQIGRLQRVVPGRPYADRSLANGPVEERCQPSAKDLLEVPLAGVKLLRWC